MTDPPQLAFFNATLEGGDVVVKLGPFGANDLFVSFETKMRCPESGQLKRVVRWQLSGCDCGKDTNEEDT